MIFHVDPLPSITMANFSMLKMGNRNGWFGKIFLSLAGLQDWEVMNLIEVNNIVSF